jgi:hypothetical protein
MAAPAPWSVVFNRLGATRPEAAHAHQVGHLPQVHPDVAGRTAVPAERARALLGSEAWDQLMAYYRMRDRRGVTRARVATVARQTRDLDEGDAHPRAVERRNARLKAAGLLVDHERLREGQDWRGASRRVLGALVRLGYREFLCVPDGVICQLAALSKRGGRRPGAGRPLGAKDKKPRKQRPRARDLTAEERAGLDFEGNVVRAISRGTPRDVEHAVRVQERWRADVARQAGLGPWPEEEARHSPPADPAAPSINAGLAARMAALSLAVNPRTCDEQSGWWCGQSKRRPESLTLGFFLPSEERKTGAAAPAAALRASEGRTEARDVEAQVEDTVNQDPTTTEDSREGSPGLRIGGTATPRRLHPGLPPRPTHEAMVPAVVPDPPKLPAGWEADEGGTLANLRRCYSGACRSRFPGARRRFMGVAPSAKNAKAMLACAAKLAEYRIAPAAWAAFSCDVWRGYSAAGPKGDSPPSEAWVWSAKRVEQRHGWFGSEEAAFAGGHWRLGPSSKALLYRWDEMRRSVQWLPLYEQLEAAERILPKSEYAELLRRARAENAATQAELNRQRDEGGWLWD